VLKLTCVDLFSGGGGLTVGLKRAGFKILAAVEIDSRAFATYKANHPEAQAYKQDIRTVRGKDLLKLSPGRKIDLVAGCPPCQGYTSLTSKYRREDPRNELLLEMSRIVREIKPRAVMMENVPGLAKRGKLLFDRFLDELSAVGYRVNWEILQAADYGVPQTRRRLVLLAGKGFHIPLPPPTHSKLPRGHLKAWRTLRNVIKNMPDPLTLEEARARGGPQLFGWHVVRTLSTKNIDRMKKASPGKSWRSIPKKLRPICHKELNTGFSNVYGRLSWDQVSSTITGGCTTFSKGRFGHPQENRTISVREAALIQTFPSNYILDTLFMDDVCDIVGNALPCDFAKRLSEECANALKKSPSRSGKGL